MLGGPPALPRAPRDRGSTGTGSSGSGPPHLAVTAAHSSAGRRGFESFAAAAPLLKLSNPTEETLTLGAELNDDAFKDTP